MIPLKSKTCTIISFVLLALSFSVAYVGYIQTDELNFLLLVRIMCWLLGVASLFFATKIKSNYLKIVVILLNFISLYNWLYSWLDNWFDIWRRFNWIGLAFLKIIEGEKMKKIVDHKGLCLAMILSTSCFLTLYHIYDFYFFIEGLFLELLMIILGITGIYLSMKIRQTRWRWFLLGINYFFATYFHVVFLLYIIFDL